MNICSSTVTEKYDEAERRRWSGRHSNNASSSSSYPMKGRLLLLLTIFLLALGWLFLLLHLAPEEAPPAEQQPPGTLEKEEGRSGVDPAPTPASPPHPPPPQLHFPSSMADLHAASARLSAYLDTAFPYVLLLFASAYLFKQTFAVPGSVFMNVLAGAVFGLPLGFSLCSLLTAVGATQCYLLARFCGRDLAKTYFPQRLEAFQTRLRENQASLAFFLLFLRLFPMSPNWAINMSCGVLGVPVRTFFLTVLVGLMPYNYVCVQAGALLSQLEAVQDIFTLSTMLQLSAMALVALLPGLVMRRKRAET